MKNIYKASLVSAALIVSAGALAGWSSTQMGTSNDLVESTNRTKTYTVDGTHSGVNFKIRHRGVANFYGQFSTMQGTIELDKLHMEQSSMDLVVPIKSVYTGDRSRDGHIKGADFLNMRQYPEATFKSTGIKELSEGVYAVTGDFTLQGKTVSIVARLADVESKLVNGMQLMGFEANFSINRSDFGITKYLDADEPEDSSLGDRIELVVFVEAVAE